MISKSKAEASASLSSPLTQQISRSALSANQSQPSANFNGRTIVIPIDDSVLSANGLEWLLENVIDIQTDKVILMHSRPLVAGGDYAPLIYHSDQVMEESRRKAHDLLNARAKKLLDKGVFVRAFACVGNNPVIELERQIQKISPSLVAITTHQRDDVSRMFLGSWANHLLHHLKNIPVLLIPLVCVQDPKTSS